MKTSIRISSLAIVTGIFATTSNAFATSVAGLPTGGGGNLPWERVLGVVVASLSGNTAKGLALLAFVVCGIGYMFSEGGGGMRKLLGIGVGISLIVGAGSLVSLFFQGGSGLAI
jgi:type IV secretory pathway VirB2 component (pilin)